MSPEIVLMMELFGGPWDGEFRAVHFGWNYPDAFTHRDIESQGQYDRDGETSRYVWRQYPAEVPNA